MNIAKSGFAGARDKNPTKRSSGSTSIALLKSLGVAPLVLMALLLSTGSAKAKNSPNPVPQTVLNAKTIFVDNQTTNAQLQTAAYADLTKWGRYEIVDSAQKADLILRISNGNMVRFSAGTEATSQTGETKPPKPAEPAADESVPPGFTRVTLADPKTGNPLWSGLRKTSGGPATWHLLEGMREAIEKPRNAK